MSVQVVFMNFLVAAATYFQTWDPGRTKNSGVFPKSKKYKINTFSDTKNIEAY